jgi:hypothetical protein
MTLAPGSTLQDSAGQTLGSVLSVERDTAGKLSSVVVQTADGAKHVLPAKAISLKGNMAITNYSSAQITAAPAPK